MIGDSTASMLKSTVPPLDTYRTAIRGSKFWDETSTFIQPHTFEFLNCYALGSPTKSTNAMYQFAYVLELAKELGAEVRISDPVLCEADFELLRTYSCQVSFDPTESSKTLYFLPHAPLDLTDQLFATHKPTYLLGNDMIAHTDRLTKAQLHEKYPNLSLLVHSIEKTVTKHQDDFQVVQKKKKRNRFVPQVIDYDYSQVFFSKCTMDRFKHSWEKGAQWGDSFSDLAWHVIA